MAFLQNRLDYNKCVHVRCLFTTLPSEPLGSPVQLESKSAALEQLEQELQEGRDKYAKLLSAQEALAQVRQCCGSGACGACVSRTLAAVTCAGW